MYKAKENKLNVSNSAISFMIKLHFKKITKDRKPINLLIRILHLSILKHKYNKSICFYPLFLFIIFFRKIFLRIL